MPVQNIWSQLDFSDAVKKTSYDYLKSQSDGLIKATKGILKMDIEAVDVIIDGDQPKPGALYILCMLSRQF